MKSKGLGDDVERLIKITKLHHLAKKNCGCNKRKEWLNKKFPKKT